MIPPLGRAYLCSLIISLGILQRISRVCVRQKIQVQFFESWIWRQAPAPPGIALLSSSNANQLKSARAPPWGDEACQQMRLLPPHHKFTSVGFTGSLSRNKADHNCPYQLHAPGALNGQEVQLKSQDNICAQQHSQPTYLPGWW